MFQTFISRHNSNFFSDKLVLTSVTPASSAPVLQTPKATSSTLYFDSLTVNAGNGGFLHCIQMDTSVNAANQVVSVGADIAFDADPKFFACLVRFESSSVPTTLPTAYDVYPLDGRHDGGYYTVKDCVTIDVLPRTPVNKVYVGFMVWSNFFFFQAEDGIRDVAVIGVQTCALPISLADTVVAAEDLVRRATARGVVLQVGHVERFNRAVRAAAPYLDEPRFLQIDRLAPFQPREIGRASCRERV